MRWFGFLVAVVAGTSCAAPNPAYRTEEADGTGGSGAAADAGTAGDDAAVDGGTTASGDASGGGDAADGQGGSGSETGQSACMLDPGEKVKIAVRDGNGTGLADCDRRVFSGPMTPTDTAGTWTIGDCGDPTTCDTTCTEFELTVEAPGPSALDPTLTGCFSVTVEPEPLPGGGCEPRAIAISTPAGEPFYVAGHSTLNTPVDGFYLSSKITDETCDCASTNCCAGQDPPGMYEIRFFPPMGMAEVDVGQGGAKVDSNAVPLAGLGDTVPWDIYVLRSHVVPWCTDEVFMDWVVSAQG